MTDQSPTLAQIRERVEKWPRRSSARLLALGLLTQLEECAQQRDYQERQKDSWRDRAHDALDSLRTANGNTEWADVRMRELEAALKRIADGDLPELEYRCRCGLTNPGSCEARGACRWNRPPTPERMRAKDFARQALQERDRPVHVARGVGVAVGFYPRKDDHEQSKGPQS